MTRPPMAPVSGLSRTSTIPAPPLRRPTPEQAPAPVRTTPQRAPAVAPGKGGGVGRRESRPEQPVHRTRSTEAAVMRPVTLSLPSALVQAVRERARRDGISQPDVLMDAIVASQSELTSLLADGNDGQKLHSDGVFVRRTAGERRPEPLATLTLRLLSPNVDAIDDLVRRHEAPSRSALCVAALEHFLKPK